MTKKEYIDSLKVPEQVMQKIIEEMKKPTLIMAPNKILAAQLYAEMKERTLSQTRQGTNIHPLRQSLLVRIKVILRIFVTPADTNIRTVTWKQKVTNMRMKLFCRTVKTTVTPNTFVRCAASCLWMGLQRLQVTMKRLKQSQKRVRRKVIQSILVILVEIYL